MQGSVTRPHRPKAMAVGYVTGMEESLVADCLQRRTSASRGGSTVKIKDCWWWSPALCYLLSDDSLLMRSEVALAVSQSGSSFCGCPCRKNPTISGLILGLGPPDFWKLPFKGPRFKQHHMHVPRSRGEVDSGRDGFLFCLFFWGPFSDCSKSKDSCEVMLGCLGDFAGRRSNGPYGACYGVSWGF